MLTELINGVEVEMSAEDEAAIRAEWAANADKLSPVPQSISDRQFFQQLAVIAVITQDDALKSNAAVIPPPLLAIIDSMPADQQFSAKMLVSGATIFERSHPMTAAIGAAYGWTDEQIDGFFRAAAIL